MIMPAAGALLEQLDAAGLGDVAVHRRRQLRRHGDLERRRRRRGRVRSRRTRSRRDGNGVQSSSTPTTTPACEIETVSFGALAVRCGARSSPTPPRRPARVDGPTLIETIAGISDLEVTTGSVTYAGTNGVPEKDVVILTVEDGEPALHRGVPPGVRPRRLSARRAGGRAADRAIRRRRRRCTSVGRTSTPASWSPSSVRTAPARRHCSTRSPGCCGRRAGRVLLDGATSPAPNRPASCAPGWRSCPSTGGSSVT